MRKPAAKLAFALALSCIAACKSEDYHYPDLLTDIVEVDTDSKGRLSTLRTDDQLEYRLGQEAAAYGGGHPDTTYRARCRFTVADQTARLYAMKALVSPHPQDTAYFKQGLKTDPLKLTSIWKSGSYINLHVGLMTKGEDIHRLHFVKSEKQTADNGRQRIDLLLYHDQGSDFEAYTKDTFLSCPLTSLELEPGDSIYFSIQTYDGLKIYGFER